MIWPVILSGGAGTRLWPLSRAASPKQFHALLGEATLLQATAARVGDPARFHPLLIVCGETQAATVSAQLAGTARPPAAILVEPAPRNTAPAIALAAHWVAARDPGGLMLIMPSDHAIADPGAFQEAVGRAVAAAADGWLVTFGIAPDAPETGYGYLELGDPVGEGVRQVARFVEKPDAATAAAYVAGGRHAWNGGIFLFRADRLLAALADHAPAIAAAATAAWEAREADGTRVAPGRDAFLGSPSDSIDYAVMEKDARVAVAPVAMGWSDIGSWDALAALLPCDADGNSLQGEVVALDTRNCHIRSDGPVVAAIGVEGLTVVATPGAVLVARRGDSQSVKDIVARLDPARR